MSIRIISSRGNWKLVNASSSHFLNHLVLMSMKSGNVATILSCRSLRSWTTWPWSTTGLSGTCALSPTKCTCNSTPNFTSSRNSASPSPLLKTNQSSTFVKNNARSCGTLCSSRWPGLSEPFWIKSSANCLMINSHNSKVSLTLASRCRWSRSSHFLTFFTISNDSHGESWLINLSISSSNTSSRACKLCFYPHRKSPKLFSWSTTSCNTWGGIRTWTSSSV